MNDAVWEACGHRLTIAGRPRNVVAQPETVYRHAYEEIILSKNQKSKFESSLLSLRVAIDYFALENSKITPRGDSAQRERDNRYACVCGENKSKQIFESSLVFLRVEIDCFALENNKITRRDDSIKKHHTLM